MFGLSYLKLGVAAAILLLVAGLFGTVKIVSAQRDAARAQLGAMTAQRDDAIAIAQSNAQAAAELRQAQVKAEAVAAAARARIRATTDQLTALRRRIANATTADDGPVAPVLRAALAGLRQPAGPDGDTRPGRAAGSAGGASTVQPGAATGR